MKHMRLMLLMLVVLTLIATGCAKKTMENQGSTDQTQTVQNEPVSRPKPAPDTSGNDARRDKMAAYQRFVSEHVYFDFDSAVLRSDAMENLRAKAAWLENNQDVNLLVIEGHCDERGTDAYNMALGARRADAVKRYLTDLGLASNRFKTLSYGEERPLDMGHNEEAWAKNRRAAFLIDK